MNNIVIGIAIFLLTAVVIVGLLIVFQSLAKKRKIMATYSDELLLTTIEWEQADGAPVDEYFKEYNRRHHPRIKAMSLMELGEKSSKLTKLGDYNNAYSLELRRRCCAVKEETVNQMPATSAVENDPIIMPQLRN